LKCKVFQRFYFAPEAIAITLSARLIFCLKITIQEC
jgi:hypothetical protein